MMLLLYDTYEKNQPSYYKAFKQLFPTEVAVMDEIKKAGKSLFPRILQSVEAGIVLNRVTKELALQHPQLPLLTIHDSIMAPVNSLDIIEEALDKELTPIIGKQPGLKQEHYNKEDAIKTLDDVVKEDWNELYQRVIEIRKEPSWLPSEWHYIREEPLLYRIPILDGKKIFCTRYFDPNYGPYYPEEEDDEEDI